MREDEMQEWADAYIAATDSYGGGSHVVLADMRGLKPAGAEAAEIMGKAIGYARSRGVVCCAHISDSTIARLQAARIAREASPNDDVTTDVVSIDEAELVLAEARARI
ncbi:MAG TPA: hypothetical protein VF212_07630 [Longimicrobiales bacterium]